jgi:hypothetical protein
VAERWRSNVYIAIGYAHLLAITSMLANLKDIKDWVNMELWLLLENPLNLQRRFIGGKILERKASRDFGNILQ